MIIMKAKEEGLDFYEVLDYYLEMIRNLHKRRYKYVGKAKASSNPLMFTQGGAYGGNLEPNDDISSIIESWTASFGITALHESTILRLGTSLREDRSFAIEVLEYINKRVDEFKEEDGRLYAIYNSPSESLCSTQVAQFRKKYGTVEGVTDKEYFSNSNHLWVGEEVTPFEKQDMEIDTFNLSRGGHIGYVRVANPKNKEGLKSVIRRGVSLGFYQGVNFNACLCEDCGYEENDMGETCPKCGSYRIDETNRTCGYLGKSRIRGDRTFNKGKMAEIKDRVSM